MTSSLPVLNISDPNQNSAYFHLESTTQFLQTEVNLDDYFAKDASLKQPSYSFLQMESGNESPKLATSVSTISTDDSPFSRQPNYDGFNYSYPSWNTAPQNFSHHSQAIDMKNGGGMMQNQLSRRGNSNYYQMAPQNLPFQQQYKEADFEEKEEETDDSEDSDDDLSLDSNKDLIRQMKMTLLSNKVWNDEMDELLLKLGAQYKCDWKKISKKFNHKKITPHFIKMRYKEVTYAAPITRRVKFNHREDLMIAKYFEKYGSNWTQMAVFFPDRTAVMLKNRYYSFIRKRDIMELLLRKAREIEGLGMSVDKLNTPDAERYTECMDFRRENYQYVQRLRASGFFDLSQGNFSLPENQESLIQHEEAPVEKEQELDERDKELMILRARCKSLQSLYLQTKAELEKYKPKY